FQHASVADFSAGLPAAARPKDVDAVQAQLPYVALGGGVLPHFAVHGRGDQQGAAAARQAQGGQQVVGQAVGKLGQKIGAGRRDEHGTRAARQVDVRHAVRNTGVPGVGVHGAARQRLHGGGG